EGTGTHDLVLFDDAILEHVVTHRTVVSVRRDFALGKIDDAPEIVGITLFSQKSVTIRRENASALRGFGATVLAGVRHIAEGKDHLLFVVILLLTAPLVAHGKKWEGVRSTKESLRAVLAVVSAFTIGHSLSLAACVLGGVRPPARVVETLVAASILVTAVHAIRPILRRESVVSGLFGLVHGFAFGTTLASFGFHGSTLALALFGFNVGIELMQLFAVGIAMPWILLLARTPAAPIVRTAIAAFGIVASLGWIVARVLDHDNVVSTATDLLLGHTMIGMVALAAVAVVLRFAFSPPKTGLRLSSSSCDPRCAS
ncbi:MAG TPA: HupE/UreJ family protein, partial [Polyangiaceae bacterium]